MFHTKMNCFCYRLGKSNAILTLRSVSKIHRQQNQYLTSYVRNFSLSASYCALPKRTGDVSEHSLDDEVKNARKKSEPVSIFFPRTGKVIHTKFAADQKSLSLFVQKQKSNQIVELKVKDPNNGTSKLESELREGMPKVESLDEIMWRKQTWKFNELPMHYSKLSKDRLTMLVVITAMAGYGLAPAPFHIVDFLLCAIGTGLTSCSANSMNQFLEIPYDSQMNRTKNRVLVRGVLSPLHAIGFSAVTAVSGLSLLYFGLNPVVAALGAINLILYTSVYTPMKRIHIVNTWIGAIVGAIPPVMGWAACTGSFDIGALLLGAIMYSWQFPHFNSLSWNLRPDYSRAGYKMMSVVNPDLCKKVALRHSIGLIGLCTAAPLLDVTTWTFAVDSLPLNLYCVLLAWRFKRDGDSNSSRKLFRFSLIHIPALMLLMFISKKKFIKAETTLESKESLKKIT